MNMSRAITQTQRFLTWVVAAALFAMMALQFVDVIARKLLGTSVPGTVELIELMMLAVVFAGLPLASLKSEHVVFDMFDHWLATRWQHALSVLANLVCAGLLLGASWLVVERAARTASFGDITPRLGIGLAGFHYAIGALLFLTGGVHLWLALRRHRLEDTAAEVAR
ncbi:MAG: TRAP transporter small permease [Burkholderiales bacterium]